MTLQEIMYSLDWTQIVVLLGGTAMTALAVVYRKKVASWRAWWQNFALSVNEFPLLLADVRGIRAYVSPNGGGSMMDAVSRTERAVHAVAEQVDLLMHTHFAELDINNDDLRFYSNEDGTNAFVSHSYAQRIGVDRQELLGWGWLNYVHPDDLASVRDHWDECRAQGRTYRRSHRFVDADGKVFAAEVTAVPIPRTLPIRRWIGLVRELP